MRKFILAYFLLPFPLFAFDATIPVLNLQEYQDPTTRSDFLSQLQYACEEIGFFALTGTGIDPSILDKAYEETKKFFYLDFETKNQCSGKGVNGQRGFTPGESPKGETRSDFKEFYHIGRELSEEDYQRLGIIPNIWPENRPLFQVSMTTLFQELEKYMQILEQAFEELIGVEKSFLSEMTGEGEVLMRALFYPANPPKDGIWGGEHTDIDLYTILPRSTAKGLQIKNKQGQWIDVIIPDDAFVINIGDMLENLTNGRFRSSWHRVVSQENDQERFSIVYFVHPRSSDFMGPLPHCIEQTGGIRKYPNATRLELLQERLIDLGLASRAMMEGFISSGAIKKFQEVGRASPKAVQKLQNEGLID